MCTMLGGQGEEFYLGFRGRVVYVHAGMLVMLALAKLCARGKTGFQSA